MSFRLPCCAVLLGLLACCAPALAEDGWGSITGQFVLDGETPDLPELSTTKDQAVCGLKVPNYSLVVDSSTKGIANLFIYMRSADKVHPALAKPKDAVVVFDQKNCIFKPHAMFVRTDQKVKVISSDPIAHNTHGNPLRNQPFNFILAPNDQKGVEVAVPAVEPLPMSVVCDIHPWMQAYWLILDHPYAAVTDKEGRFKIENLPAGTHEFRVWQEKIGYVDRAYQVTVENGKVTELEPVKVPAAKFEG